MEEPSFAADLSVQEDLHVMWLFNGGEKQRLGGACSSLAPVPSPAPCGDGLSLPSNSSAVLHRISSLSH